MSSLDRYLLRQSFGVMVFVTAALSAAVWLAQSLRLIDLIVNRGMSFALFLYLALLILPRFLDIVLPIGVFIAVLFTFNRAASDSELIVMRAAGMSPLALAKPVLVLAGIAFAVLVSLSAYFLPASNREFKDLLFQIRHRFVSSLIQDGTFTAVSDKLTLYAAGRNERGEVVGLLISDDREPQRPVTILADRGAFVDTPAGSRLLMIDGSRQQFDTKSGKLSVLTFDRYTLDLETPRDAPVERFREAQERFLYELWFPPKDLSPGGRWNFLVEAQQRLLVPLSAFAFALIPLACLLPGEYNRRGQMKRIVAAIAIAFVFEALAIALGDLVLRYGFLMAFLYLLHLLPIALAFGILHRPGIGFGFWRLPAAALPAR
jgi:lipopolysaccharide export system permease protein